MCAGPAFSIRARETSGSSSRTQASTSGSSGMEHGRVRRERARRDRVSSTGSGISRR